MSAPHVSKVALAGDSIVRDISAKSRDRHNRQNDSSNVHAASQGDCDDSLWEWLSHCSTLVTCLTCSAWEAVYRRRTRVEDKKPM